MKVAILLLAAGRGSRLGATRPKAYLDLGGRPLLLHCAERLLIALQPTATCDLIVVAHPDDHDPYLAPLSGELRRLLGPSGRLAVAPGGSTRQESMQNGLGAALDAELIVVHDAARPLVPIAATRACLAAAAHDGAALLAIPATDTLKQVREGAVVGTLDRSAIWYAQTPQIARRELLERACRHAHATGFEATDDVALIEHLGAPVRIVPGTPSNLKITRPDDVPLAAALLAREAGTRGS